MKRTIVAAKEHDLIKIPPDKSGRDGPVIMRSSMLNTLKQDTVYGISVNRAYKELLQGKTSHPVIVAVIDEGVDDIHGWNFLGGKGRCPAGSVVGVAALLLEYYPGLTAVQLKWILRPYASPAAL